MPLLGGGGGVEDVNPAPARRSESLPHRRGKASASTASPPVRFFAQQRERTDKMKGAVVSRCFGCGIQSEEKYILLS